MNNAKIIVAMGGMAVGSCVVERLCSALGKQDIAQYISVFTTSLIGVTVVTTAYQLLNTVNKCMK